jgi:hypothetical protein
LPVYAYNKKNTVHEVEKIGTYMIEMDQKGKFSLLLKTRSNFDDAKQEIIR